MEQLLVEWLFCSNFESSHGFRRTFVRGTPSKQLIISLLISFLIFIPAVGFGLEVGDSLPEIPKEQTDYAGQGKDLEEAIKPLEANLGKLPATRKFIADSKIFSANAEACAAAKADTANSCEEIKSPFIREIVRNSALITSAISSAIRAKDSCSKIADGVGVISSLLPLFGQSCRRARSSCLDSCGKASGALTRMSTGMPGVSAEQVAAEASAKESTDSGIERYAQVAGFSFIYFPDQNTSDKASITTARKIISENLARFEEKKVYCDAKAGAALASGIATAGQALQLGSQSADCNKKADGDGTTTPVVGPMTEQECALKPGEPQCSCDLPAHANTRRCLCNADPRNLACNPGGRGSGELQKLGAGGMGLGVGGTGTDKARLDFSEPESDPTITLPPKGGDEPAARGSAGIGGGFGGSGGGNQIGGPTGGGGGGAVSKATNPSGFMGSGGSVGRLSNNDGDEEEKKKKRGIAEAQEKLAGAMLAREISSTGGKSNWEKVKIRYTDNAPTLLGK